MPVSNKWDIYNSQAEVNILERWEAEKIPDSLGAMVATVEAFELHFHLAVSEIDVKEIDACLPLKLLPAMC